MVSLLWLRHGARWCTHVSGHDLGGPGLPVSPLRLGLPEDRNFLSTFSLFLHQQGQDSACLTILHGGLDAEVGNTSGGMTAELDEQTDRQSGTG